MAEPKEQEGGGEAQAREQFRKRVAGEKGVARVSEDKTFDDFGPTVGGSGGEGDEDEEE